MAEFTTPKSRLDLDQLDRIEAKVDYLVQQKQRRSFKRRLSDFFQNLANKLK